MCVPSACVDGQRNGKETDVDCGGPECARCRDGRQCIVASDCVGRACVSNTCQCVDPARPDMGAVDLGAPTGACLATGDPSYINILKRERATGECVRMLLLAGGPYPGDGDSLRVPCGWRLRVIELYPRTWDCSERFQAGIPEDFSRDLDGDLWFGGAANVRVPCSVSLHAGFAFAKGAQGAYRLDVDDLPITNGCR